MKLNKLFHAFKQKMIWENLLKSLLLAAMLSACGVFITSLVYHIMIMETPILLTALIGGGIFILSFFAAFFIRYPTRKRVAARIDAMGLQERATTMLAFQNVDTEIVQLQRTDAITHIQKTSPKQMNLQIKRTDCLICIVSICLAFVMLVLPFNVFAFGETADNADAQQDQIIKDLIAQLREDVKEAELEEQLKESLDQIIDELEEDLESAESELEQAAQIQAELEAKEYDIKAGGGVVALKINGKKEVLSMEISPEIVDPDDIETLSDVIVAAVNEAIKTVETDAANEMGKITGGMGAMMPGLF